MKLTAPVIEWGASPGFTLRQWQISDAERLCQICRDPDIRRFTSAPNLVSTQQAGRWIETQRERAGLGELLFLAIVPDLGGIPVGSVHILHVEYEHKRAELGYWLAPEGRHRGLATKALKRLSEWCFAEYGFARLELLMTSENRASHEVAKRAGYSFEGVLRSYRAFECRRLDLLSFGRIATDPTP